MKKMTPLLLTVALVLILPGCKKHAENPTTPDDPLSTVPTNTAVGTPLGNTVTKTIGGAGGSIASSDGKAELTFPAGALDANTSVSIQAVTQTAPNGVGYGYRFLPEGIRFRQPVSLKFHYTADDLAATLGDWMGIAFQDSIGGWWRVNNFTNDTANKIILAPIKHLTVYTPFSLLSIDPKSADIKVKGSIDVKVTVVESDDKYLVNLKGDGELLAPLVKTKNRQVTWSINGSVNGVLPNGTSPFGSVSGTGLTTAYNAPAKVPQPDYAAVTAAVDLSFTYHGKIYTKDEDSLLSKIRIVDGDRFKFIMRVTESVGGLLEYTDYSSMDILINADGTVAISNITNTEPDVNPESYTGDGCTLTWVPDSIGEVNVVSVAGTIKGLQPGLTLIFTHAGTVFPGFRTDCEDGSSETMPGFAIGGFPSSLNFNINNDSVFFKIEDGHITALLNRLR